MQIGALSPWQSALFLIGVLLIGTPDGLEIVHLGASILVGVALIPKLSPGCLPFVYG